MRFSLVSVEFAIPGQCHKQENEHKGSRGGAGSPAVRDICKLIEKIVEVAALINKITRDILRHLQALTDTFRRHHMLSAKTRRISSQSDVIRHFLTFSTRIRRFSSLKDIFRRYPIFFGKNRFISTVFDAFRYLSIIFDIIRHFLRPQKPHNNAAATISDLLPLHAADLGRKLHGLLQCITCRGKTDCPAAFSVSIHTLVRLRKAKQEAGKEIVPGAHC